MQPKVILSLSGGMDSGTLLAYLVGAGHEVKAYSFLYGSKHNEFELVAAKQLAIYYNVSHDIIDLRMAFSQIQSNLMQTGAAIPEGHYNDATMSKTVVPGRNHIFASVLAGIAESLHYDYIALAVHAGDHTIYPDCRAGFISALERSIRLQSEGKVSVLTPFLEFDKEDILKIGYAASPKMPYEFTRTCYKSQALSCGKCGSCTERLEAFERIGIKDPVQYEVG